MYFSRKIIYSVLVVSVVSGCGVAPRPISIEEVAEFALTDIDKIYKSQEGLPKVLTLSDAMARALKYNLDNRVKLMEQTVASKNIEMAEHDMWPMLGLSAGYLDRSNVNASTSQNIFTGNQSLAQSTSQQREQVNANIRFTWNILDFGVSYLQARQNAEKYLISQKTREKVMLKLLQQVRSAYWRAVVMQRMSKNVNAILKKVDMTLADLKAVREKQLYTPLFALNDIRALVETKKQLEDMKESITIANVELATLINVPSSTVLSLETPENFETVVPKVPGNINEMELTALLNSTDYTSEIYNVRIEQMETHKALLRLLPGIEFSYAGNYSSNSFLFNNLWGEAGVRLAGDLLKLLTVPDTLEYGVMNHNLAISRRLAVNTAVVAGVHLAWQNYANSVGRLEQTKYLTKIDDEIASLTRNAQQNRSGSEVEAIQNEFKAFGSQMSHLLAYTKMQDSFGAFLVSLGTSPVPDEYQKLSVGELAKVLNTKYQSWEKGDLEIVKLDDLKKRIAERAKQEEDKSVVAKIIDDPHYIFPDLTPDTETRKQEIQAILQQKSDTPAVKQEAMADKAQLAEVIATPVEVAKNNTVKASDSKPSTKAKAKQKAIVAKSKATAPETMVAPPQAEVVAENNPPALMIEGKADNAAAKPSLVGSKWHYVDKEWQYDIEFAANNVLITTHPKDKTKNNDSWEQDGDNVHFYFNNKFSHFQGVLSGDKQMLGIATNKKDSTWSWKATRI